MIDKTETLTTEQYKALGTGGQTFHGILRNANPRIVNGKVFASATEADRYVDLFLLERSGAITKLETEIKKKRFDLRINGVKVGHYTADFVYLEKDQRVIEEVKRKRISDAEKFRLKVIKACLEMDLGCEFRVWSDGKYVDFK